MIRTIIKMRVNQLVRLLTHIGWFRIIFLSLMVVFVFFFTWHAFTQPVYNTWFAIITTIMVLFIHINRKDRHFLKILVSSYRWICMAEYILMLLPLLIISLAASNLFAAGYIVLLCLFIPWVSLDSDLRGILSLSQFLISPVHSQPGLKIHLRLPIRDPRAFEWKSGMRSGLFIILPVYLIILAFSFKPAVGPIGMMVLSFFVSGFYYYGESRDFIEVFAGSPQSFIGNKMMIAAKYLVFLFMPIILVSLLFQFPTWYFVLGAFIISIAILAITIIFKYALFQEHTDLNHNSMIVIINILCILLPFLWPVPLIMGIRYYSKAINNLKPYFDDHHT